jgi:hypothetical protein
MQNANKIAMTDSSSKTITQELLRLPVLVAALGYLVDMYDLFLFSIVRVPSLKAINLSGDDVMKSGIMLVESSNGGIAHRRNCLGNSWR